jgi:membrane protease YdiL (CAAX protease family)
MFLIVAGFGLGTVLLPQTMRLAVLWTLLVVLSVIYRGHYEVDARFTLGSIGRGALLGLVIAAPILAFLAGPLRSFTERLYDTRDVVLLFYQVCFIAAPVEGFFFRGIVQGHRGSSVSIGLYAVMALIYFLPHVQILAAFIVFLAMGLLGILYSYVADRYGLAASIACHVVVGFVLQVMPSLLSTLSIILSLP